MSCHDGKMAESKEELLKEFKDKLKFVESAKKAAENGSCSTTLDFEKAADEVLGR